MPLQQCTVGGKSGWKWGESGKCYTGLDAKAKATAQGRAIKVRQGENMFQTITANYIPSKVRHDQMEGRDYLVAPMVMITEGIHNGNNGPLYYPESELSKFPESWNHKPVVVYHPENNGAGKTACDPVELTTRKVGVIMNTKWDAKAKKLRAEAWLEKERIETVDPRIGVALEKNELMEVSTGLYMDAEQTEEKTITRNYKPDHLALLPDKKGACSVDDGAGLFQLNALSHSNIHEQLMMALKEKFGRSKDDPVWVMDVFPSFVVYHDDGKMFKLNYSMSDTQVTLSDDTPVEVVRVTEYRTMDGAFVGNASTETQERSESLGKEMDMAKKELIDGLISNEQTKFAEKDREFLDGLAESQLELLEPIQVKNEPPKEPEKEDPPEEPVQNEPPKDLVTTEQFIQNAPPEIRKVLNAGLASYGKDQAALIKVITSNEANTFQRGVLEKMDNEQLEQIAALARKPEEEVVPNYAGAAALARNTSGDVPCLDLPSMSFDSK